MHNSVNYLVLRCSVEAMISNPSKFNRKLPNPNNACSLSSS